MTVATAGAVSAGQNTSDTQVPGDYVISADDILTVAYWDEEAMSAEVTVRPDGRISLPLVNEIDAAGLTPSQLAANVTKAASKFLNNPRVTVMVKEIRSRKIFVVGEVAKPGMFPLNSDMNVLQAISAAGGLLQWANRKNIRIVRTENGVETRYRFNYNDAVSGKNPGQNIALRPGDVIVVPD